MRRVKQKISGWDANRASYSKNLEEEDPPFRPTPRRVVLEKARQIIQNVLEMRRPVIRSAQHNN